MTPFSPIVDRICRWTVTRALGAQALETIDGTRHDLRRAADDLRKDPDSRLTVSLYLDKVADWLDAGFDLMGKK